MARSRASAKKAGTAFETELAGYLTENLGMSVRRLPKSGAKDLGDLTGVTLRGRDVVIEAKNPGAESTWAVSGWWAETEAETVNAAAEVGILVIRRARRPVSEAWCVVSQDWWDLLRDSGLTPTAIKSISNRKWPVAPGAPVMVPRRGRDDHWVVFCLSDLPSLVDTAGDLPTVHMTGEQVIALYEGRSVVVTTDEGTRISLAG